MAVGSTRVSLDGPSLSADIQTHLGQRLEEAYATLPDVEETIPARLSALLEQLTTALAAQSNRDALAFRRELEALFPNLRRFSLSLTRNPSQAEDLVQDTLLKAWKFRARFVVGTNLGAWLFTIMRNNFLSGKRRDRFEGPANDEGVMDDVATVPDQLDRLDVQDVQRAITALPLSMQRALILVAVEGLSYEAAAIRMQCEVGTVKSRVSRARQQLSMRLGFGTGDLGVDHITLSVVSGQGTATHL